MAGRQYWLGVVWFLLTAIPVSCRAEQDAVAEWKRKISVQLAAHKRFPPSVRGQTGEAMVKFELDRSGKLISKELVKSTGVPQFDAAALEMVESSQPFPPAPPEITELSFTLPVIFANKPVTGKYQVSDEDIRKAEELMREETKVDAKMRSICRGC